MNVINVEPYDRKGFAKRLTQVIGDESRRSFARRTGMSGTSIGKYENEEALPNVERLVAIAIASGVDLRWLACGDDWESILAGCKIPTPQSAIQEDNNSYAVNKDTSPLCQTEQTEASMDDFTLIDSYQVFASAGQGSFVSSEQKSDPVPFRTEWLKKEGLCVDRLAVIRAKGDSMEPTISDDDVILVNLINGDAPRDGLYVLRMDTSLFVKRLQFDILGGMKVISDNPGYDTQVLTKEQRADVEIIGRVVWAGKKF
ncbi:XRE family transcriptional regulator [Plesiomonas shigelloides]|uniref:XRE family transcriptional regulator n=1 Tax=Plesiomonas shigelloides TaxID=703 RepID=UPI00057ABE56|nr:LexA family transcriptional regulator [Plesiomonas shigelloides]